jgi:hypothetical protein
MKMVKSLLLGSAATLVAVAGAQAADLPVKAKAVEYVKVCSLYGAGFYYIPGTDTCIKIGGYLRADFDWQSNPTMAFYAGNADARYDRGDTSDVYTRSRFNTSWDVRAQTEYGTLRTYARVGWQATSQGASNGGAFTGGTYTTAAYIDRAMIQFAGFTFGKAQSFSDFSAPHGNGTYQFFSDTGGTGTNLIAYTAQFGNGLSLTVAAEDASYRRTPLIDGTAFPAAFVTGAAALSDYMGQNIPDFVGNLRLDQAWGSAQVSGALHQVAGAYYGTANSVPGSVVLGTHPGDKWGWNVRGGLSFNIPWGPGDQLILEGSYGEGASHYAGNNYNIFSMYGNGGLGIPSGGGALSLGTIGLGVVTDGVFYTPGGAINAAYGGGTASGNIELTKSYSAYASFQHFWTPSLRTSIFGGVFGVDYNDQANAILCTQIVANLSNPTGCNFDFKVWQVGGRGIWSPVTNLDLSIDVFYSKLDQEHNTDITLAAAGARPAGRYTADDQDSWAVLFRAQRNFWY